MIFLHQRNEWHNEATPPNVREPSVALPVGLCRRQKGETREEGGHILDMFALSVKQKRHSTECLFFLMCGLVQEFSVGVCCADNLVCFVCNVPSVLDVLVRDCCVDKVVVV